MVQNKRDGGFDFYILPTMIKNIVILIILFVTCYCSCACNNNSDINESTVGETTIIETTTAPTYDYDLAEMNATMFFSLLKNLIATKDAQVGKTIRIKGEFNTFYSNKYKKQICTCVVMDATMCCPLGVRLHLPADKVFPDDYPKQGDIVTLHGVLGIDKEYDDDFICINEVVIE